MNRRIFLAGETVRQYNFDNKLEFNIPEIKQVFTTNNRVVAYLERRATRV